MYLCSQLIALVLYVLDLLLYPLAMNLSALPQDLMGEASLHLVVDKLQSSFDGQDCFSLVLLQQHWPDQFVDIGIIIQPSKFLHLLAFSFIVRIRSRQPSERLYFLAAGILTSAATGRDSGDLEREVKP